MFELYGILSLKKKRTISFKTNSFLKDKVRYIHNFTRPLLQRMCYVFDFHCVIGKEQLVDIMVSSVLGVHWKD